MPRASTCVTTSEHTSASGKVRSTPSPNSRSPIQVTSMYIVAVAAMMTISLPLSERTGSSGRRSSIVSGNGLRQDGSSRACRIRGRSLPLLIADRSDGAVPGRSSGGLECVPDAVDRPDQLWAELAPQRLDVGVDRAGPRRVGPVPHVGEQPLAGEHG